jgi:WD40 repeat protein
MPPAELAEYNERLSGAAAASQLVPTLPSVSLHTVTSDHPHAHCATFHSKNSLFCFGFSDSSLRLWPELPLATDHMTSHDQPETTTAHQNLPNSTIPPLLGHRGPVYGTSFNSKGSFLLSSSEDCTVRLWDVDNRSCVVCYHGHQYPVWNVTFSPVDVYFISCSHDTTARLWTCDLAYPLRIFAGHTAGVNVAEFHPNGKYVATGSSDHTCRLWDIHSGHCVRLLTGKKVNIVQEKIMMLWILISCASFAGIGLFACVSSKWETDTDKRRRRSCVHVGPGEWLRGERVHRSQRSRIGHVLQ